MRPMCEALLAKARESLRTAEMVVQAQDFIEMAARFLERRQGPAKSAR